MILMRLSYAPDALLAARSEPASRALLHPPLPILVILEERLPPVATIHDTVNRPWVLAAQLPSRRPGLLRLFLLGQNILQSH